MGSWEWEIAVGPRHLVRRAVSHLRRDAPTTSRAPTGPTSTRSTPTTAPASGASSRPPLTERRPWSLDYRIVRPDGELRMIHARGEVVVDENGRPSVVHGTCQDVTESHRVEDAAARRRAALPPRLRRRPDRHGAHRPRRPLAAPEPLAVPDARAQRAAAAHDRAQRAQPSRGPPPGSPADQGAAGRAPALVRDREALPARRRDHGPRARARLAHARRRRAPSVLPVPAGRHHRAPPRRGRAPGQRGAPAGDHRQLAGADHRQGPPAPLPARQPPLGGALRRARRPGRGAHGGGDAARLAPARPPRHRRSRAPRTASPTRR